VREREEEEEEEAVRADDYYKNQAELSSSVTGRAALIVRRLYPTLHPNIDAYIYYHSPFLLLYLVTTTHIHSSYSHSSDNASQ
jgi:hypothetical protein